MTHAEHNRVLRVPITLLRTAQPHSNFVCVNMHGNCIYTEQGSQSISKKKPRSNSEISLKLKKNPRYFYSLLKYTKNTPRYVSIAENTKLQPNINKILVV